jgi:hypothetical protein
MFRDKPWFHIYCFSDPADADEFRHRFGGEKFDSGATKKNTNWRAGISSKLSAIKLMRGYASAGVSAPAM